MSPIEKVKEFHSRMGFQGERGQERGEWRELIFMFNPFQVKSRCKNVYDDNDNDNVG